MTMLIDLRQPRPAGPDDVAGLQAHLLPLVGEPFRFARVSYGDELTLHFGDLRPARSPKIRHLHYGAFVLGARGSSWVVKSTDPPMVLSSAADVDAATLPLGQPQSKRELEANPLISAGGRVLSATAFVVRPINGYGLQLRFSDGSAFLVLPTPPDADGDDSQPEPADWELRTPGGLLTAGTGNGWRFETLPVRGG